MLKKLLVALVASAFALGAYAQAPAPKGEAKGEAKGEMKSETKKSDKAKAKAKSGEAPPKKAPTKDAKKEKDAQVTASAARMRARPRPGFFLRYASRLHETHRRCPGPCAARRARGCRGSEAVGGRRHARAGAFRPSRDEAPLAEYRGKVVLVNFWATWCEPCREEMPSIERLRASLQGRPFVVLAVNLAEPESRIRKFLEAVPVGFPVLLDRDTQTAKRVAGEAAACDLHRRPGRPHPLSARRRARLVQAGGAGDDSGLDQVKSILVLALALAAGLVQADEWERPPPFITTPPEVVERMLELAGTRPDDLVIDLGSGDGRIPIAAAQKFGARGLGIELDAALVQKSRENARSSNVAEKATFVHGDVLVADISRATVVTVYMLPALMAKLQSRFIDELAPGTRIVSHEFTMAGWPPDRSETVRLKARHRGQGDAKPAAPVDRARRRARRVARAGRDPAHRAELPEDRGRGRARRGAFGTRHQLGQLQGPGRRQPHRRRAGRPADRVTPLIGFRALCPGSSGLSGRARSSAGASARARAAPCGCGSPRA